MTEQLNFSIDFQMLIISFFQMAIKRAKRDPSGIEIVIFLKKLQNFSKKSPIASGGWKPHP